MKDPIPFFDLTNEILERKQSYEEAFWRVLHSGQFILGEEVDRFEQDIARYLGVRSAIGVNSGTDALVIGLKALGIQPNDEVITPSFSFFATAESISIVGAKPVFVDIDPRTLLLDIDAIEQSITSRTRAILPVHLFGQAVNMVQLTELAQEHNIAILEDCAQSIGTTFMNQQTGTYGALGAFSFFPTKNLGAFGDGGLITTNDEDIALLCRKLRSHGSLKKYHNELLGYNSRLDALQAAFLTIRLASLDTNINKRRQLAQDYSSKLKEIPSIVCPEVVAHHTFHQFTIRVQGDHRDKLKTHLEEDGISTMIYYPIPQHLLPLYKGKYASLPHTEQASRQVLSLPIYPSLSTNQQDRIIAAIKNYFDSVE